MLLKKIEKTRSLDGCWLNQPTNEHSTLIMCRWQNISWAFFQLINSLIIMRAFGWSQQRHNIQWWRALQFFFSLVFSHSVQLFALRNRNDCIMEWTLEWALKCLSLKRNYRKLKIKKKFKLASERKSKIKGWNKKKNNNEINDWVFC